MPDQKAQVRAKSDKPGADKMPPARDPFPFAMHGAPLPFESADLALMILVQARQRIKASTKVPHRSTREPQCGVFVLTEMREPFIA